MSNPVPTTPFAVAVHPGPFLLLVATGDATLDDLRGLAALALRLTREQGARRVLADLISINVLFSDEDFRRLQVHSVRTLSHLDRLAYTVPACYNADKDEPPVLPGGVLARSFTSLQDASDWMRG